MQPSSDGSNHAKLIADDNFRDSDMVCENLQFYNTDYEEIREASPNFSHYCHQTTDAEDFSDYKKVILANIK